MNLHDPQSITLFYGLSPRPRSAFADDAPDLFAALKRRWFAFLEARAAERAARAQNEAVAGLDNRLRADIGLPPRCPTPAELRAQFQRLEF